MIWAIFSVILIAVGLVLGAPFLDFLAPSKDIVLYDFSVGEEIARGAETLWHQWQVWAYIAIFVMILTACLSQLQGLIQKFIDDDIAKKREQLDIEKQRYQQLQKTFRSEKEKEIWNNLLNERSELTELKEQIELQYNRSQHKLQQAEDTNRTTNFRIRAQDKEIRSKNAQRDRLSYQKKLIVNYLNQQEWEIKGEKLDYPYLLKLASEHAERQEEI